MDKETSRRELAGDIEAFGIHNIDNLAEFLIDRGWSLDRSRARIHSSDMADKTAPDLSKIIPDVVPDLNLKLNTLGRESWLPGHEGNVLLRRRRSKDGSGRVISHPTYIIYRLTAREYMVIGAGMGAAGMPIRASITKIREMTDKEGKIHAEKNTEEHIKWSKI